MSWVLFSLDDNVNGMKTKVLYINQQLVENLKFKRAFFLFKSYI